MNEGNIKAIQLLAEFIMKEEEQEEEKVAPIFNINVSNTDDVEKLKKLLK